MSAFGFAFRQALPLRVLHPEDQDPESDQVLQFAEHVCKVLQLWHAGQCLQNRGWMLKGADSQVEGRRTEETRILFGHVQLLQLESYLEFKAPALR